VTNVVPNNGPVAGGTPVTITGTGFVSGATVTFGSKGATNVVVVGWNDATATVQSVNDSAGNHYSLAIGRRAGRGCGNRSTMRRTS
jgi:hypothetical protein